MVVIYPTVIQPLFNKLSPLREGDLRSRIESLASKLKFPLTHLYEIDGSKRSSHSNAYFFGLPWVSCFIDFRIIVLIIFSEQAHRHLRHTHQAEQAGGGGGRSGTRAWSLVLHASDKAYVCLAASHLFHPCALPSIPACTAGPPLL